MTLKDQISAEDQFNPSKVFKMFANSFVKSSSHWQARDEYLSSIKQGKQQTMAELDIYIKDLVGRCQFSPKDVESHKVDLLYHTTAHFKVRKFVCNAKAEELTYDKMIELAKAHERTCQEYQAYKQAYTAPVSNYHNPLIQTNTLSKPFRKGKSVGGATTTHPRHREFGFQAGLDSVSEVGRYLYPPPLPLDIGIWILGRIEGTLSSKNCCQKADHFKYSNLNY